MTALSKTAAIAIVGAGAMGAGIAQVAALAGHRVYLYDVRTGAAESARDTIAHALEKMVEKGRLERDSAASAYENLIAIDTLDLMGEVALVIEAIVEDLHAKRELFRQIEALVGPTTILASNTSSVSITAIGSALTHPDRFAGLHFFNPAPLMALVEVVSGLATSLHTRDTLFDTANAWGKKPVHAKSTPGFIVNRVARPFYGEGLRLLEEGVADVSTLDALMREAGGFRMGPFELMDLIGHDVNAAVTRSVFDAYAQDPRFKPSLIQQELVAAGRLGRKSGHGFYDYSKNAGALKAVQLPAQPAPERVTIAGNLGIASGLVVALGAVGITVNTEPGDGIITVDGVTLALTDGRSATVRAAEEGLEQLVLFDLALEYSRPGRIALAKADQASSCALNKAAALFQAAGWKVSPVDDAPGLVLMRSVAMLANEAADAVLQQVASAGDTDRAMRFGTNYPKGPLEWADEIGVRWVLGVLEHLQWHYGEDRYRPSALLRRAAASGQVLNPTASE